MYHLQCIHVQVTSLLDLLRTTFSVSMCGLIRTALRLLCTDEYTFYLIVYSVFDFVCTDSLRVYYI